MKNFKIFATFVFVVLMLNAVPALAQAATAIHTCQELQDINNDLDGDYVLANDIDCSGGTFIPIGTISYFDYYPFTGTFNGNDHAINGLNIPDSYSHPAGLFARLSTATVSNLVLA